MFTKTIKCDLVDEDMVKRVRRMNLPNEKGAAAITATP
jgi:hypothetical protein